MEATPEQAEVRKPRGRWPAWLAGAVLVLLTLAAYAPATRGGTVWDDDRYVFRNRHVHAGDGLKAIWTEGRTKDFYPLLYSSFWLEWRLWGEAPAGYHIVNILLHAGNALLVAAVLRRLGVPGSWLAGALFALHPVNVESVAWISQRKNTLAMLFFLLSLLAWLRWRAGRKLPVYCLALVLFTCSLLAKPLAVMFPVLVVLLAWWRRRPLRQAVAEALPFLALAAFYALVTVSFQYSQSIKGTPVGAATWMGRLTVACQALLFYLGKTVWPADLCVVYPAWPVDTRSAPGAAAAGAVALAALSAAVCALRGLRTPALVCGAFVLLLFPVLGFLGVGFQFYSLVADHWLYPALPVPLAVAAAALAFPFTPPEGKGAARYRRLVAGGVAVLLTVLGVLTWRQSTLYRGAPALFLDTLRKNPRAWVAHIILGNHAFDAQRLDLAERHYRAALAQRPEYWEALNGLGIVHAARGELDRAIPLFVEVLRLKPEHTSARRNLRLAKQQRARSAAQQ